MDEKTINIIDGVLRTDGGVTDEHRERILSCCRESSVQTDGKLITRQEAADILSVSQKTVMRLNYAGDIPAIPVGASIRIRKSDLDDYINLRRNSRRKYTSRSS